MSVTHPTASLAPAYQRFADRHPQLAPFLVAVAMAFVSVLVSLAITGPPA